jgi:hypothetical protein
MSKKKNVEIILGTVCALLLACCGSLPDAPGPGGPGQTNQIGTPQLVLARYKNIHIERIPFSTSNARTTQYGADRTESDTSVFFSMPISPINPGSPEARTYFNVFMELLGENDGLGNNFDYYTLQMDSPHSLIEAGRVRIGHDEPEVIKSADGTKTAEKRLSYIGAELGNFPGREEITFSLRAAVRGEEGTKVLTGEVVPYNWRFINYYVDTVSYKSRDSVRAPVSWTTIIDINNNANIIFRQAMVNVTRVSDRNNADFTLSFIHDEFNANIFSGNFQEEYFRIFGNTNIIVNNRKIGTESSYQVAAGVIAIARMLGLEMLPPTYRHNLMLEGHLGSGVIWNHIVLNRKQWDTLNDAAWNRVQQR